MDREPAYYVESMDPHGGQRRPHEHNGFAGPYDIQMETYTNDGQMPHRDSRWNQFGDNQPADPRPHRPRSEGYYNLAQGPAPRHDIQDTVDLLECLPSRQLENKVSNAKNTLRHRRNKSYHGTVRLGAGNALEQISRTLSDGEEFEPGEEFGEVIRGMTTTLASKREIRKRLSSRKAKKRPGRCTQLKYSVGMGWQHFKYQVAEVMYSLELWRSHLKKIEGHFGTGVTSYFLFLKWLFFINIPIFLMTFGFVVLPVVLQRWYMPLTDTPKLKPFADVYPERNGTSFTGEELLTGAGWFHDTEMYYGFYKGFSVQLFSGVEYKMIYAYVFTCGGYYILCLLILAQSILKSYRKYYIEGSSEFNFFFVSKVFCGWDYGVTSKEAARLKHKSIYNELLEYLSGKKKEQVKTTGEKCQIFWIRVATNLIVIGLLGGAGYLVYWISSTESVKNKIPVLSELALPLVITTLNMVTPAFFSLLGYLEKYEKPKNELYIHMLRTMTLRATNLAVLVYFWFKTAQEQDCWESFVGQEIYRLVIVDFIFTLLYTFFFEFVRRIMSQFCFKSISRAEFGIGRNTLDLIYSQALCWLGTFYSPLLSCIVIIKLWIIFYVKRVSVLQNCQPSMRPWRAARSHTIFLGFLFCFFLLTTTAVACGIIFIKPSQTCGPYQSKNTTYEVVIELVDSWKEEHAWLHEVIHFISSPGFIAGLVVLLCMGTYYMRIAMIGHKEMVKLLQQQLALEGKDKNFLLNLLQEVSRKRKKDDTEGIQKRTRRQQDAGTTSDVLSPGARVNKGRKGFRSPAGGDFGSNVRFSPNVQPMDETRW
ncbi:transmembrane channel-like protein 7 isoform X1 [Haliotis rubra]|uniref:transmembrane channel-like protein 7 isoform X1 n=1 Tax=Haliotis rubra TaxID=36100 RepID=UPI001EE548FE|nr:transmembrane channel-like protein 7 isoform X1 [Haliotis rubra]